MNLDLREIPAVYINLEQHTEKNEQMKNLLKSCGFKTIIRSEGVYRPDNPPAGCSGAHYNGLCEINPPFILFEDDCLVHNFEPIIKVPDDADVVYLGTSQWARYLNYSGPFVHYDIVDENIVRVYNMLAAHSILYLTPDYVKMCQRIAYHAGYIIEDYQDIGFSEVQKYFNIYSVNDPIFKQSGHNNKITACKVTDIGIHVSDAQRFFDNLKYDYTRLQGIPDLNESPSVYFPIRIV
jgi:hypothetical protein